MYLTFLINMILLLPVFVEYNINYNDQLPFPVRSWTWDVVPVCAGPFISG